MLIPKLFLGLASTAGIGGLVSLSSIATGGGVTKVWRVSSNPTFPLFTCQQGSTKFLISLELKNKESQPALLDNKEVILVGNENNSGEQTISSTDARSSNTKTYKLSVFPSGNSNLEVKESSSDYGKIIWCSTNVFKVTGEVSQVSGSNSTSWSKSFDQIKMNLNDCDKNGRKECSINIGSDVGLSWRDDFKLKVIL